MPVSRPTIRAPSQRTAGGQTAPRDDGGALELGFGFCAAVMMLFSPTFAKAGPVLTSLLLLAYAALRPLEWLGGLRRSWLILALPIVALSSAMWSQDRVATLYYGAEYTVTILLAFALGSVRRPEKLLLGLFAGFAVYASLNLLLGKSVAWEGRVGAAFGGVAGVKNYIGETSVLGALATTVFLLRWGRMRHWLLALGAFLVLGLQLVSIKLSLSSGAELGYVEGAFVIFAMTCARLIPLQIRYALAAIAVSAGVIAACFYRQLSAAATDFAVNVLHKDVTLTGRAYLWARGQELIQAKPGLGVGFAAFWRQGNLDAEGLWRSEDIAARTGFNFHSTPIEVLVELGIFGLCVLLVVLAAYGARLILRALRDLDDVSIFWASILIYQVARMAYEAIGLGPFNYDTILLCAALAYGGIARLGPKPAEQPRSLATSVAAQRHEASPQRDRPAPAPAPRIAETVL